MVKHCICLLLICFSSGVHAQIDSALLYNPAASFGPLDIRIAKSPDRYYYLKEGETFSFRQKDGSSTKTFLDMTAWDSKDYKEGNLREKSGSSDNFIMNYRLLMPQGYTKNFEKGYPLVILLHGLLERGNCAEGKCYHATKNYQPLQNTPPASTDSNNELLNNDYNLVHGGSNYLEANVINGSRLPDDNSASPRGFPGFVVFPQNLNGWDDFAVEDAIRIVRLLIKRYNIDEDRVYINGVSHGGHGAYKAMVRAPWLFAAGVLFSAADDAGILSQNLSARISDIPLWLFQGGKDLKPTQQQTERYVQQFRNNGASVRYTLYPQLGHGTWNKAFAEPEFFSWMLRHRKNDVQVYADNPVVCKTSNAGSTLSLPAGYPSYAWEKNGVLLESRINSIVATSVGAYRGRFLRRTQQGQEKWSEWSTPINVIEKDPGTAAIEIDGTCLLPDPNGKSEVKLKSAEEFAIYSWYKESNTRLKFDDTTKVITLTPAAGDGRFFLKASQYDKCITRPSSAKSIYFSDRAPYNLDAPSGLQVTATSPSESELVWTDNSNGEEGFEIWRRRKINSNNDPWLLVSLAPSNSTGISDVNLSPAASYDYMIRAVKDGGRSLYFPKEGQVAVTTPADNEPPSAPELLRVTQSGVESLSIHWRPSTDNASIRNYVILLNDDSVSTIGTDTSRIVKDIRINTRYVIRVMAVDAGGNFSTPGNEIEINTVVKGLFYQHTTGSWETLQNIDWTLAEYSGTVPDITLKPKTQQDFFNFRFDGYLQIQQEGIYQFRISSDDGSRLSLDDSVLVVNDGVHNLTTTTSPIQLLAIGHHRIQIDFFDYDRSDSLLVEFKGPDSEGQWSKIPEDAFSSDVVTDVETIAIDEAISVYPNPTTPENINIRMSYKTPLTRLSLISSTGKIVNQEQVDSAMLVNGYTLRSDLQLAPGLYMLRVEQHDFKQTIKLILK